MNRRAEGLAAALTLVVVLLSGYILARAASGMLRLMDDAATEAPGRQRAARTLAVPDGARRNGRGAADAPAPLDSAAAKGDDGCGAGAARIGDGRQVGANCGL